VVIFSLPASFATQVHLPAAAKLARQFHGWLRIVNDDGKLS
jgi:hypothetical protein